MSSHEGIISAAIEAAAAIASSSVASVYANKNRKILKSQQNNLDDWFKREYYTNALDRSDNQYLIKTMNDKLKKQDEINKSLSVISGATPESIIAEKQKGNNEYANMLANIAQREDDRKGNVYSQYIAGDSSIASLGMKANDDVTNAWASVSKSAMDAAKNIDWSKFSKKTSPDKQDKGH